jgi:hypothetical protein
MIVVLGTVVLALVGSAESTSSPVSIGLVVDVASVALAGRSLAPHAPSVAPSVTAVAKPRARASLTQKGHRGSSARTCLRQRSQRRIVHPAIVE